MTDWIYLSGLIASTYIAGIILGNILPRPKKMDGGIRKGYGKI